MSFKSKCIEESKILLDMPLHQFVRAIEFLAEMNPENDKKNQERINQRLYVMMNSAPVKQKKIMEDLFLEITACVAMISQAGAIQKTILEKESNA